jgi:hypothetical protein
MADQDEQYDSVSDEDFNPDVQAAEEESSSSDDEAAPTTLGTAKKRGIKRAGDELDADLDSGDEATIKERNKRKKRKGKGADDEDAADFLSDDEGGDGSFVRTRAQRRTEKVECKTLASTRGATVDVDLVWSRLSAIPIGRPPELEVKPEENEDDYITIKRTTKFAGQTTTEEKRVLKSSKEAKIWLEELEAAKRKTAKDKENEAPEVQTREQDAESGETSKIPKMPLRRPLKRPLKWEPNPTGEVKGLPPNLQLRWPRDKLAPATIAMPPLPIPNHRALPAVPTTTKLNTVQKSKYDWASYVDKNKLAEELDEYGRSKESYAGRTEFLTRLEHRKEEERLNARTKAAG